MVRGITLFLVRVVIRLVQPGLRAVLNRVHYRIKLPIELLYPAQCVGGAAVQPAQEPGPAACVPSLREGAPGQQDKACKATLTQQPTISTQR